MRLQLERIRRVFTHLAEEAAGVDHQVSLRAVELDGHEHPPAAADAHVDARQDRQLRAIVRENRRGAGGEKQRCRKSEIAHVVEPPMAASPF